MEPTVLLALGIINMMGHGIGVESHPLTENTRVLREAKFQPYFYNKDQNSEKVDLKAVDDDKVDYEPFVNEKYEHPAKKVTFIIDDESTKFGASVLDEDYSSKDQYTHSKDDVIPEEASSVKSPNIRRKRKARKPKSSTTSSYNQSYTSYNNDDQGPIYNDYNNAYNQRYNGNGDGYNSGNKDFVDDFVDHVENLADSLIINKTNEFILANNGAAYNGTYAFNNGKDFTATFTSSATDFENKQANGSKYPNSTVYSQQSGSVYTYGDENLQGITLTKNNINVIQPMRNITVLHKNSPGHNLTIISDVPAYSPDSDEEDDGNNGYDGGKDEDQNTNNKRKTTSNQGTKPKPKPKPTNNGDRNSQGHKDFVDDFIDRVENYADRLLNGNMNGFNSNFSNSVVSSVNVGNNGAVYNQRVNGKNVTGSSSTDSKKKQGTGSKNPENTVYMEHSDNIYTYGDGNIQGITLTNTNINVNKPTRTRTVLRKNLPGVNLTIISD